MEVSPAAKVGMIVVLALVMFGLVMSQLSYWKNREVGVPYYVVFNNVSGLQVGAPVRKAGVDIGRVTSISIIAGEGEKKEFLDKVRVKIYIRDRNEILSTTSLFTISSTFMGDKWLEILPRQGDKFKPCNDKSPKPWDEPYVVGQSPVTLDDLIVQGQSTLTELQKAVDNFNGIVGDSKVQRDIKDTVSNFKAITGNIKKASARIDTVIDQLASRTVGIVDQAGVVLKNVDTEIRSVGGDVRGFTATLKRMAVTNEGSINQIVKNLNETSHNLNVSMKAVKDLVTNEKFGGNILKTLDNIANASEEIEGIAEDVRSITNDPKLKEDVKATIREARQTVEGAKDLIKRVRATLGIGEGEKLKLLQLDTDMQWNTTTGRSCGNANLFLLPKARHTMKVGVEDIGNANYFNLQYGQTYKSFRPRIGIVRSAAGLGTDAFLGRNFELNLDAYDPNKVKVDVLGKVLIDEGFYITGGVRDAFDAKYGVIGVGKRF
ncbi:MAG: MlaD family protein [Candidatus Eremiobacteraeota bacterium]|nr:MlaD family protein [Candidatus Eremiobacteraeota bacterium]